jgi:hypothetical protein
MRPGTLEFVRLYKYEVDTVPHVLVVALKEETEYLLIVII